ncbi:MAG: hypothetical protein ABTQ25_19265 [Nitrosomonas ureae]
MTQRYFCALICSFSCWVTFNIFYFRAFRFLLRRKCKFRNRDNRSTTCIFCVACLANAEACRYWSAEVLFGAHSPWLFNCNGTRISVCSQQSRNIYDGWRRINNSWYYINSPNVLAAQGCQIYTHAKAFLH